MRFIFLLTIVLFSSCENRKETIANRQQAIQKEMEEVKADYYKQSDSLETVKRADTNAARQLEIMKKLVAAEREKTALLIPLQREYDSLEVALKK